MMMNTIFRKQVAQGWLSVYMDDITIHTRRQPGETEEEHHKRHCAYVHLILDILKQHDLYLKPEKCTFEQKEIDYLGVIVGEGTLRMDPKKIQGVADWSLPTTVTEIQQFLGFMGYYCYFVPNYSKIARPLLDLTKKTTGWHWEPEQMKAFETLKTLMCCKPVLAQPDFSKCFYLQMDASVYGVGAILLQAAGPSPSTDNANNDLPHKNSKPKLHPIAYYSTTFTPTERNYDIYERELLAIMKSLAHWRHYLGWTKFPFIILTDHANLQYWKAPKNLNRQTAQWHVDLQEYNFIIHHIPGKANMGPDILSRSPTADQGKGDNWDVVVLPPEKFTRSITIDNISKTQKRDLMTLVHDHSTAGHPGQDEMIRQAKRRLFWPGMNHWITQYMKECATCQQNKILVHCTKTPLYRISTPEGARPFQQISMDLITGLPRVHGKDAILTIVNHGCS
jgi:reverse transcriptase-like protein/integrase-like protein